MFREKKVHKQNPELVVRSAKRTFEAPLAWHRALTGKEPLSQRLVFVCSWGDFWHEEADPWREEAFAVMRQTPHLIYQITTKRLNRAGRNLPPDWITEEHPNGYPNVWIGVSIEEQAQLLTRLRLLDELPAVLKFVSFEPLLTAINLGAYTHPSPGVTRPLPFSWSIIGGESGHATGSFIARPAELDWIVSLAAESARLGATVHVKQMGSVLAKTYKLSGHGEQPHEWLRAGLSDLPQELPPFIEQRPSGRPLPEDPQLSLF